MPQGLQVMDASGNIIFDTNTVAGRIIGTVDITASTAGSVTSSGFSTGTPFWVFQPKTTAYFSRAPSVTISGNTLSWDNTAETTFVLTYGVL
jgi:predicted GTPase